MSKIKNWQQVLNTSSLRPAAIPAPEPARAAVIDSPVIDGPVNGSPVSNSPVSAARQSSRTGQVNISAWMDPRFKASLRLVQARKGGSASFQHLIAEALNDLFIKYEVPAVRPERE